MLKAVVGHSDNPDSRSAIDEVLEQCTIALAGETPQAGLLFSGIDFDHSLILKQINLVFPEIDLIGGTTDGEVSSVLEFQQNSLVLMLFCSDTIQISAGVGRELLKNPAASAKQAVDRALLKVNAKPRLCITVPEGFTASGESILDGLKLALGSDFPIFGGLAADRWRFKQTYQFFQTEVLTDAGFIPAGNSHS